MSSWNLETEVGDRGHKYDFLELDGLDGQMIFSKFIVDDNLIRGMQRVVRTLEYTWVSYL